MINRWDFMSSNHSNINDVKYSDKIYRRTELTFAHFVTSWWHLCWHACKLFVENRLIFDNFHYISIQLLLIYYIKIWAKKQQFIPIFRTLSFNCIPFNLSQNIVRADKDRRSKFLSPIFVITNINESRKKTLKKEETLLQLRIIYLNF